MSRDNRLSEWNEIVHHSYNHDPLTCESCTKDCKSCKSQLESKIRQDEDRLHESKQRLENWKSK